ncbi:EAL domain-containing protein [Planococcus halotolerans]|uniref:EAL domain-containing protein n=1 Tax=Planococcus halotolerans TaxID=2233542 RepID=UPI0010931912|nr:EAL domain-containing protein [Planococcus halotolerans]QHJ72409.1 EAL domain-containing protein [Planococcus halotolerans]
MFSPAGVPAISCNFKISYDLKSLIHLAQSIECELLAEGVERPEEVLFLKEHSCTVFQGYYYNKPLQIKDFEEKCILKSSLLP